MPTNFRNEDISESEMERFIRGPHIGQSTFSEMPESYRAWYYDFVSRNPNLAVPQR